MLIKGSSPNSTRNKGTKPFTRPLSLIERGYLVYDRMAPPLVNQMVIEGEGELDLTRLRSAVQIASLANPGSRLVLRGCLGGCHWVDSGKTPPVKEMDGNSWDGLSPDGAPILKESLYPAKGPTCEVLLMHGNPKRVVFRSHHAVMDGRGTMVWAEDVFRILKGEDAIGSNSTLTEFEIAKNARKGERETFPRDSLSITGEAKGFTPGVVWLRRRVQGQFPNLLSQVAILLAREARRHGDGNVLFSIPIDLRSRFPKLRATNNLTSGFFIEVKPEADPRKLTAMIAKKIHEQCDLTVGKWDHLFHYVPLWLLRMGAWAEALYLLYSGNHSYSGMISAVGKVNLDLFSCTKFQPRLVFFIPPSLVVTPLMVISESGGGIDLSFSMPRVLASGGRIEEVMDRVVSGLEGRD